MVSFKNMMSIPHLINKEIYVLGRSFVSDSIASSTICDYSGYDNSLPQMNVSKSRQVPKLDCLPKEKRTENICLDKTPQNSESKPPYNSTPDLEFENNNEGSLKIADKNKLNSAGSFEK